MTRIGLNRIIDGKITSHAAGSTGFSSSIGLDDARHTAVVLLSNSRAESMDDIGFHILDPRSQLTPAPLVLPPTLLARYVGTYAAAGRKARIIQTPRGLSITLGAMTARLYALDRKSFLVKLLAGAIDFRIPADGHVSGLELHLGDGRSYAAKKIS